MHQLRFTILLTLLLSLGVSGVMAQTVVTDDISSDVTWNANTEYVLDGLIFVNEGATLTIEAGTVIKARAQENITTGDGASALIIRRDGMINARGTETEPIIFTSEFDDLTITDDLMDENGNPDRRLWGGVIILGNAPTNQINEITQIEGIPVENEEAGYGGNDPEDNSGVFAWASIRHGGFSISGVEGDEINGLTMGGVGSATEIHHVEVFANFDDCFEWFGGAVSTKYLVGAFCGDDTFDYDQGYRAYGQYWFAIQPTDQSGRGGEHDGCDPEDGVCDASTFSQAIVSNATYLGAGINATPGGDSNDLALRLRENVGAKYFNSVFHDYPDRAIRIDEGDADPDAVDRFLAGDLQLENNVFGAFGAGDTFDDLVRTSDVDKPAVVAEMEANNVIADPDIAAISRTPGGAGLDPRPNEGSLLLSGASFDFTSEADEDFFDQVAFRGAFSNVNWALGWTALDAFGYFGDITTVSTEDDILTEVPSRVRLEQNYPNPFNPSTSISYSLAERTNVRLTVHDLLGRELTVLLDGEQESGQYTVRFGAHDFSSGMYLYRLETAERTITRNMLLLK